jgi:glycosyltransferase involved in cell wall biosynthesis
MNKMQQTIPLARQNTAEPRVALVHDYLIQDGGGERVLQAFQELYPDAPTFTLFHDPERAHKGFRGRDIRTSMLQKWPLTNGREQWTLPFMPMAIEHLDLSGFDVVISSSSAFAKGVIAPPGSLHVCYLHTPTRFLWEERMSYVNDLPQPKLIKRALPLFLHRLRMWDRLAAERPDVIVTNSETSRKRIYRYYGRDATVIHPPVDVERIPKAESRGDFWLTGGRLVGYKRFELTVLAFKKLNMPLKVFGIGPELDKLRRMAGPNTEFLGRIPDEEKVRLYAQAVGFINPQVEDFGITAVEAMAAGKPVIAYDRGGAKETVIRGITGEFIEAQTWEDIGDAVIRFNAATYDPVTIRAHAEGFSKERFKERFKLFLDQIVAQR